MCGCGVESVVNVGVGRMVVSSVMSLSVSNLWRLASNLFMIIKFIGQCYRLYVFLVYKRYFNCL